ASPAPAAPRARRVARGFTLVEVMVALLILAIVATLAWQGVDGIVRTRDASEARLQQTLRLGTLLAQWEQDLSAVQDTNGAVPSLNFDGASLRLVRRAEGGLQLVVWSLRPSTALAAGGVPLDGDAGLAATEGGSVWLRWAGPVVTTRAALQETWLRSQQFQGTEPGQLPLLGGLAGWQLYFYRGNAWTNAQSSGNSAPGTTFVPTQVVAPTGVRLVLEMAPGGTRSGRLTRDVALGPQP
ncbi:prepilin-type N-terminal cleavage/methylation domain-containing protein, partial [Piscinibacter sakaiensis]